MHTPACTFCGGRGEIPACTSVADSCHGDTEIEACVCKSVDTLTPGAGSRATTEQGVTSQ